MNVQLDPIEARIIGCLMEKSMITPEQYPLSLNALVNACNQKSSREPVMALSEGEVQSALDRLAKRYLVREKSGFGSRVPKYHYRLYNDEIGEFRFTEAQRALIAMLLLRGPQTPGELRTRTARIHEFSDTEAVEAELEALAEYPQGPFVTRLAREPGRREARYAECFQGLGHGDSASAVATSPRPVSSAPAAPHTPSPPESSAPMAPGEGDLSARVEALEQRVAVLESALRSALEHRLGE